MISSFPLKNRLILFILMIISTILLGSLGYTLIKIFVEHQSASLTNAIYFSVVTISTLGHYPAGVDLQSEVGKWFTIIYLIFGLGVIFGGIQALLGPWIELKVKSAVHGDKRGVPEDAHVIIAGYNDVADIIAEELDLLGIPFVIVDENAPPDYPAVMGRPTEMGNLMRANIGRAKALLAIGSSESNAVTILTARNMNEKLNIIALAENAGAGDILKKSGANFVVRRDEMISSVISHWVKGDLTYQFTGEIFKDAYVEEKRIESETTVMEMGKRMKNAMIIGVYRGGELFVNPSPQFMLHPGDVVIILKGVS